MLKIIFIGTAEFAVPSLQSLLKNKNYQLQAVITQPDRPASRGLELQGSPIKKFIRCKGRYMCLSACSPENTRRGRPTCLPILSGEHIGSPLQNDGQTQGLLLRIIQPQKIIEIKEQIKKLKPDILVVCAYGEILSKKILIIPRLGAINIHASLLPKYRGASPIQAAILHGDKYNGVSIIQMDEKMDHGPIISQARVKIEAEETAGSLHNKLAELGARLLELTLDKINQKLKISPVKIFSKNLDGRENQNENLKFKIKRGNSGKNFEFYNLPTVQDEKHATYTKKLNREDGLIQPHLQSAREIERMVRAYNPWPGTYIKMQNSKCKIQSCPPANRAGNAKFKIKILKIHQVKVETLQRSVLMQNKKNATDSVSILKKFNPGDLFVWNKELTLKCRSDYLILQKVQIPGKKIISGKEFARGYWQYLKSQM